ncbi:hypothetical protein PVAND_005236 [Polypedilum vanderplanki]|uniref:Uncharacterized protein n=1 Tax=Polypedilum vanderplanki TaxID=319348 RepID=A0A9J6C0F7_POLVA|nr:hypothetical protein PVAND_005236 [Polypedilum vanderplanki]
MKLIYIFIYFLFFAVVKAKILKKCVSVPCVRSSANILERIDTKIDPCEDFYSYACGSFAENYFTPDEKSTVDSLSLMSDKLQEYLLTLLSAPIISNEPQNHKIAKLLFNQCTDYDRINERGKEPIIKLFQKIGGFPMIEQNWNENEWEWENAILKLRYYISKKATNIFENDEENDIFADISQNKNFALNDDFGGTENNLRALMTKLAIALDAKDDDELQSDVNDLIEFEKQLSEYSRIFKIYRRRRSIRSKPIAEFQKMHKWILWLDIFAPSVLSRNSKIIGQIPDDFNLHFYEFLKSTKKRTLANYVAWRIMQVSMFLMGEDIRQIFFSFEQSTFGNEDYEQRWKLCTSLVADKAPVAIGALYISEYFSEADKIAAEQMVNEIIAEYKNLIKNSIWIDEVTKSSALEKADNMLIFIGYHEKLRQADANNYYNELQQWDEFFEMTLSLTIFRTDKDFKRAHSKDPEPDWTKYSKPATVNAFYNSKDNSIQFPASILQFPFFDKFRPDVLNFGGIGSIIGHEITHSFDDFSSKFNTWSEASRNIYNERIKCLIDQYSSYHVPEIEKYFNISNFHLNGMLTLRENIADNGGVKLAYYAFKKRSSEFNDINLVGLESLTNDKLFYISFAQAFCSVERPTKMKSNVESDLHTLSKFRVIGVLSNLEEFSRTWNCSTKSPMNPVKKCALW